MSKANSEWASSSDAAHASGVGFGIGEFLPTMVLACRRPIYWASVFRRLINAKPKECPLCNYSGKFRAFGHPPRYDAECPRCGSLERHRLLAIVFNRLGIFYKDAKVLHFAPEPSIAKLIQLYEVDYNSADIVPRRGSLVLNIEKIELPADSVDVVVANHVLEHVNDKAALAEIHRILRPGGNLIASVPIVEGWSTTYEDAAIQSADARELYYGQRDHVRIYGRDFRARVAAAGFALQEFNCGGLETMRYALKYGGSIFVGKKEAI
jgi:SAM-dependent methyltransferase